MIAPSKIRRFPATPGHSYANEWKSASSSTQSSFVFSTNIGPTAQFSKEKDAFLKIISDEIINM